MAPPQTKEKVLARLKEMPNGCWEWQGNKNSKGYGMVSWKNIPTRVHRLVYYFFNGPIPEKLYVCHKCDNTKCANPDHLFLGTHADNMRDASRKGRMGIHTKNGNSPTKKLTEQKVLSIFNSPKSKKCRELAKEYGVAETTIGRIRRGEDWNYLTRNLVSPNPRYEKKRSK